MRKDLAFPATDPVVAVYDLNSNTRTFDFAYFLVGAECFARLNGHHGFHLLIVQHDPAIVSMRNAEYARANKDTQRWRFENIILPLINLCPACVGYSYVPMSDGLREQLSRTGRCIRKAMTAITFRASTTATSVPRPTGSTISSACAPRRWRRH